MTITIRLFQVIHLEAQEIPAPTPASITAKFAIRDDTISSIWYKYTQASIPPETSDVQAYLDAIGDELYEQAQNNNEQITQSEVNAGNYAWQHWTHKDVIADAHYTMENGMFSLGTSPTAAQFRTRLTNTMTVLAGLAGTDFETHFNNKRAARGLSGAITGFTLTQCDQFDSFLREWITARRTDVLWAKTIVGLS